MKHFSIALIAVSSFIYLPNADAENTTDLLITVAENNPALLEELNTVTANNPDLLSTLLAMSGSDPTQLARLLDLFAVDKTSFDQLIIAYNTQNQTQNDSVSTLSVDDSGGIVRE